MFEKLLDVSPTRSIALIVDETSSNSTVSLRVYDESRLVSEEFLEYDSLLTLTVNMIEMVNQHLATQEYYEEEPFLKSRLNDLQDNLLRVFAKRAGNTPQPPEPENPGSLVQVGDDIFSKTPNGRWAQIPKKKYYSWDHILTLGPVTVLVK